MESEIKGMDLESQAMRSESVVFFLGFRDRVVHMWDQRSFL